MVNRFFTIMAIALSVGAFVYIFIPDKWIAAVTAIIATVVSIGIFVLEHIIKQNGSQLANAFVYFFTRNDKYIFKEKTFEYERIDDEHWKAEKKYKIESHCHTLEEFEDRFCWSANSKTAQILPIENEQRISRIGERERWTVFTVKFARSIGKKETIYTGAAITNLQSEPSDVKPFLSANIDRKTSRLKMIVKIPARYDPKNAKFMAYSSVSSNHPVFTKDITYDTAEEVFCVTMDYPRKNWRYVISWEYGNEVTMEY